MAIWLPKHDAIVTAAPGTGSTALMSAVAAIPGARRVADMGVATSVDAKHGTVAQFRDAGVDVGASTIVTTTRHPHDFYVADWWRTRTRWAADADDPTSWVHHVPGMTRWIANARRLDFGDWVDLVLRDDPLDGSRRINEGHVSEATVVVRMEDMSADLHRLAPELAAAVGPIPRRNNTPRPLHWRDFYDDDRRRRVIAAHRRDMESYDYRAGQTHRGRPASTGGSSGPDGRPPAG